MWEGWKNIDCYLYLGSMIPRTTESTYDFLSNGWIPLSNYGIMRGRPQITGSSRNGSSITIPGRNGTIYDANTARNNAKVSIELLVANVWTHKDADVLAIDRADQLMVLAQSAKYFAYKEPGRDLDSYFIVRDTKITITDANENAQTVKIEFEVCPVRYWISGLIGHVVNTEGVTIYNNFLKNGEFLCGIEKPNAWSDIHYGRNSEPIRPVFDPLQGTGTMSIYLDNPANPGAWGTRVEFIKGTNVPGVPTGTILDTDKCLAYAMDDHGVYTNENDHFGPGEDDSGKTYTGDYTNFWVPVGRAARVHVNFQSSTVYIYTNEGMLI